MDRCDAYHHFAAQCVELARTMDSALDRSVLLEMALVWSRLAEYAAKTVARKERAELETARGRREAAGGHLGQILRLSLQPTADDASAHLAIGRPILRETMVHNVVGFDAECVLDDLGGAIAVVAVDGLLERRPRRSALRMIAVVIRTKQ